MPKRSVAGSGTHRTRHEDQEQGRSQEECPCFYCLEGWVFIGTLNHDGEEVVESHRCRRCNGSGVLIS